MKRRKRCGGEHLQADQGRAHRQKSAGGHVGYAGEPDSRGPSLAGRPQNAREHQANKQVSRVATLLQLQSHNLTQLVHELSEAGYRTRWGKAFHLATVRQFLVRAATQPLLPAALALVDADGQAGANGRTPMRAT